MARPEAWPAEVSTDLALESHPVEAVGNVADAEDHRQALQAVLQLDAPEALS